MEEINSSLKIGLTLIIIGSIIVTIFSIFVITDTFSRDVYEEQARAINVTHSELQDIVNTYLPMLALDKAISDSKYGNDIVKCTLSTPSYTNGVRTFTTTSNIYDWSDVLAANTQNVGCVRQIDYVPSTHILTLHIELGG